MSLSHRTYVFGDYWEPKGQLSELGLLISKAKDRRDPVAVTMFDQAPQYLVHGTGTSERPGDSSGSAQP